MSRKKTIIIILCLILAATLIAYLALSTVLNSPAALYVDPKTTKSVVGQDFIINISISSVHDLYAWDFNLSWASTILSVVNVTEGPFLKSGGNSTYFNYGLKAAAGQISVECTRVGNVPGATGSGVLATIKFNAQSSGQSPLDLYYALLLNSATPSQAIPYQLSSSNVYSSPPPDV